MDIRLERGDLLQLDPISNTGTLKLFPPGKKFKVIKTCIPLFGNPNLTISIPNLNLNFSKSLLLGMIRVI